MRRSRASPDRVNRAENGYPGGMGIVDKAKNSAEKTLGKAKEAVGDATGNDRLRAEGKKDQTVAGVKKVGEKIKDTFK